VSTVRELPLASYPTGSRTIVRQTPNGLAGFNVTVGRCTSVDPTIWPDLNSRIKITVEASYGGGLTFPPDGARGGWEQGGGIIVQRGVEIATSVFSCRFNPEATAVRITAEIINGPIRTFADITTVD